jgi:hypothetical protein
MASVSATQSRKGIALRTQNPFLRVRVSSTSPFRNEARTLQRVRFMIRQMLST